MADERVANAVDKRLGELVRARRLQIGMSQERLAGTLGVTIQQVQKYERGVNRIAASRLVDIATAIDTPIARLFEGIGSPRQKDIAVEGGVLHEVVATREEAQIVASFGEIKNQRVRRRVVQLVRALVDEQATAANRKPGN